MLSIANLRLRKQHDRELKLCVNHESRIQRFIAADKSSEAEITRIANVTKTQKRNGMLQSHRLIWIKETMRLEELM